MNALVDTNILVRLSDLDSPIRQICYRALQGLLRQDNSLYLCAQTAIEFWSVATRPKEVNGLGLDAVQAEAHLSLAEQWMIWLPEPSDIGVRWRALVNKHNILGKKAHDVRLIALMDAYGLTHLVTLNPADFGRFTHVTCIEPNDVLSTGAGDKM